MEAKELAVNIEPGMKDGDTVVFPRTAEEHPGVKTGDVVFFLKEKKHPIFTVETPNTECGVGGMRGRSVSGTVVKW